jgi:predicted DNA-binding transcriptional regulator YafY
MTTPQITIHDAITGETITRDFNAVELAQAKLDKVETEAQAEAQTAKQAARQAVLDKLGLTADEAAALLG